MYYLSEYFPTGIQTSAMKSLSRLLLNPANVAQWSNIMPVNTLRPKQNGHDFADNIYTNFSKIVPKGPIHKNPSLVPIMIWGRTDNKSLPMIAKFTYAYMHH